jgi:acyl-coenzyme A synthetase/AMP-(fatty) acid ligase
VKSGEMNSSTLTSYFSSITLPKYQNQFAIHCVGENDTIQPITITFHQLDTITTILAEYLIQQYGITATNIIVGICIPTDPLSCILYELAVWKAGGGICPVDVIKDPRGIEMLHEAKVSLIIADTTSYNTILSFNNNNHPTIPTILAGNIKDISQHLSSATTTTITTHSLTTHSTTTNISHIIFTSGSTGKPKGIIVSNHSLLCFALAKMERSEISSSSRIFLASAFTFDPWLGDLATTLVSGACLIIAPRERILAGALPYLLVQTKATHCCTTPSTWSLATSSLPSPEAIQTLYTSLAKSSLEELAVGGERMGNDLVQNALLYWKSAPNSLLKPRLVNTYGVTECCVYQTTMNITKLGDETMLGIPYKGVEIVVVVPENQQQSQNHEKNPPPVPKYRTIIEQDTNQEGEIAILGPFLGLQYTTHQLVKYISINGTSPQPVYLTGDIAQYNQEKNNNYHIIGRRDTQFKISGVRIEAGEIESCLVMKSCGLIQTAIVEYFKDLELLIGIVKLNVQFKNETSECTKQVLLRGVCTRYLPQVYIPSRIVFWPTDDRGEFPITQNGKIDRKLVREWVLHNHLQVNILTMNNNNNNNTEWSPGEFIMAQWWTEMLNVPILSPFDSFTHLGGDSLQALRLVNKILSQLSPTELEKPLVQRAFQQARSFGEIDGLFAASRVISCPSLRGYVNGFDREGIILTGISTTTTTTSQQHIPKRVRDDYDIDDHTIEAVMQQVQLQTSVTTSTNQHDILIRLLHDACRGNYIGTTQLLIRNLHVPVNGHFQPRKHFCRTPLHEAALLGHVSIIELLLQNHAHPMPVTEHRVSPLHLAGMSNSTQSLTMLFTAAKQFRVDESFNPIFVQDSNKQTIFHYVARGGKCEMMEWLLKEMSSNNQNTPKLKDDENLVYKCINDFDRWKRTPLHWAVINLHIDMIRLLRKHGAEIAPYGLTSGKSHKGTHLIQESVLALAERRHAPREIIELLV